MSDAIFITVTDPSGSKIFISTSWIIRVRPSLKDEVGKTTIYLSGGQQQVKETTDEVNAILQEAGVSIFR